MRSPNSLQVPPKQPTKYIIHPSPPQSLHPSASAINESQAHTITQHSLPIPSHRFALRSVEAQL